MKARAAEGTPTLSGSGSTGAEGGGDAVAQYAYGKVACLYNPVTGELRISYNGDPNITVDQPLQRLRLTSASGSFKTIDVNESGFDFVTKTAIVLDLEDVQTSIADAYNLGSVLPAGWSDEKLM